jgi:hypothetical protein
VEGEQRVQEPQVRARTRHTYRAACACDWVGPERLDERRAREDQVQHTRQTGHVPDQAGP